MASISTANTLGDAEGLGSDDDADARYHYELMTLCDPATGKIPVHARDKELAFAANLPKDGNYGTSRSTSTTSLNWVSRGPWNVGGRTRAFAIDANNENNLVAGTPSGGMWRSTDKGNSWVPTMPSNEYKSVSCLAQDTRTGHTNVWYFGTGEAYGASASGGGAYYLGDGIYKSVDSGVTWTVLPSTTTGDLALFNIWSDISWNIVTNPADTSANAAVYVAAYGAIYKSADGGVTWTSVLGSFESSYFTDIAISKTGVLYASLSTNTEGPSISAFAGLYRSVNGDTWVNITPDSFPTSYNRVKIGISPSNEDQVYFLGNTPGFGMPDTNYLGTVEWNSLWRYTYVSGDGSGAGGAWQNRSANLPSSGGLFDKYTSQGSYDMVVKVKPDDTNVVFIGGTNLYRSNSAFRNATSTTYIGGYQQGSSLPVINDYLNHHPDQHELVFVPSNPDQMYSTNDGGIFFTTDNTASTVAWNVCDNGYITTMFYTCAIDHTSTDDIIIGGAQDNGSWFTNNTTLTSPWVSPRGGDGTYCAIADSGQTYYFSIQDSKIMRAKLSSAGVVDSFARIDPIGGADYQFVNPFVIDPNNNSIMYLAGGHSLWRNNNLAGIPYASNWDTISTNWVKFPDSVSTLDTPITAIAVSTVPANRVYFGTADRRVFRVDGANVGTPAFTDITSIAAAAPFPGAYVSCIAVDPTNADNVIVVYSNYNVYSLFYSQDGGTTWSKIGGNLEQHNRSGSGDGPSCRWASIMPVSGGYVYMVGTSVGLFATTTLNDTFTVWTQQGANTIGASVVDQIDYRLTDGLVVVATHSSGMFSGYVTQLGDITEVKSVSAQATPFKFINYPNPFANATTIDFDLGQKSPVTIDIYDPMGRLVTTVANSTMDAGNHKVIFDSNNLAPGIYYCTLQAGAQKATNKMLIIQ